MTTATNTQDLDNEDVETQDEVLEQDDEQQQEVSEVASLKEEVQRLSAMISNMGRQAPQQEQRQEKPKGLQFTPEQLEAFKTNPALLVQFVTDHAEQTEKKLQTKLNQNVWDGKAYEEFPALKNDEKFKKLVTKEIQSLVVDGDLSAESPKLLYTAAKIAANKYESKDSQTQKVSNSSGLPPSKKRPNTAPTEREKSDFNQKTKFLRMAGISEERIKKMIERSEKSVHLNTSESSGKTRRIVKL